MNFSKLFEKNEETEFTTFPRTFEGYAWYKPIIVFILASIIMFVVGVLMSLVTSLVFGLDFLKFVFGGGIDGLNSAMPIIFSDLLIFMFVPGLYLASKIVNDRPFSSYASSRGGWNFKLYLKALIIPVILFVIFQYIDLTINGANAGTSQVSILFLIVLFITIPLQSIAEEFMFRGILMQTLGSWFKIPILAVIIQAIIFALAHGYNSFGFVEMIVSGLVFGFFAWKTNGIEVSSALHTANNFCVGFFVMLGLYTSTSSPQLNSVLSVIVFEILLCILMHYLGKKTDWFGEIPENS
ncbi:MAG: CPBP family intramembrane metalloprotease [Methanobrevibacter sp.]|nr:CPBP family intramembrane metalloprotease [Methanobrevibacter sp.]